MDEGKLRDEVARGVQAEAILRNPIFDEAFETLLTHYNNELLNSLPSEKEKREQCYYAINMLQKVQDEITSIMQTGKMASKELGEDSLQ